jgi:hypothetical protein
VSNKYESQEKLIKQVTKMEMSVKGSDVVKSTESPMYTNSVNVVSSFFDFQFSFYKNTLDGGQVQAFANLNQAADEQPPVKITSEELCILHMSPQHVKVFLDILKNQVDKYEATFGEIKLPEGNPNVRK